MGTKSRPLRELYSVDFATIVAGSTAYAISVPLPGAGLLIDLRFTLFTQDTAPIGPGQYVQLVWLDSLPSTVAQMNAAEFLFPLVQSGTPSKSLFIIDANSTPLALPGPYPIRPQGRGLAVRWANTNSAGTIGAQILFTYKQDPTDPRDSPRRRFTD